MDRCVGHWLLILGCCVDWRGENWLLILRSCTGRLRAIHGRPDLLLVISAARSDTRPSRHTSIEGSMPPLVVAELPEGRMSPDVRCIATVL
jgi:hypothetical protein